MNKFLKLTSSDGKALYLRASAINMITEDKDGTVICYGNDLCYMVKEDIDEVMNMFERIEINPCIQCGRKPKVRYDMPYTWIQCQCGRKSQSFIDGYEQNDPESRASAVRDWNRKNVEATE